jgi:hypothetical protein
MAMPGHAQQAATGRYTFADTTLLRDTLGLKFDRLFPLADSLGMAPQDLRALSITARRTPIKLVFLADSMHVVVDSVGAVLQRERFNPLAGGGGGRRSTNFVYTSTYDLPGLNGGNWTNNVDLSVRSRHVSLTNSTSATTRQYIAGGLTSLQLTRVSKTDASWIFSRNLSMGGVATLNLYDDKFTVDHSGSYGLSVRTQQQPARGLTSNLTLSSTLIDKSGNQEEQRGLQGTLNGNMRYVRGGWFTNDFTASATGNVARTRPPGILESAPTQDHSGRLSGTLGLYSNAPVGLNVNYNWNRSVVEQVAPVVGVNGDSIQSVLSGSSGVNATLRLQRGSDRTLSFTQRFANSQSAIASSPTSQNTRSDRGFAITGRYVNLDTNFGRTLTTTEYPRRGGPSGGYGEDLDARTLGATLNWQLATKLHATVTGGVDLTRFRYFIVGTYANPPVPRDQYDQSYSAKLNYEYSRRFTTGVGLEVDRSLFVNIPAASTAANNETRGYRANWDWTYHLLPSLTANQKNQAVADYTYYTFLPPTSDRLVLEYTSTTTVSADIFQGLHLDLTHYLNFQPTGGYAPLKPPLNDGNSYFSQSDEGRQSSLRAGLTYSFPAVSITITPVYSLDTRKNVVDGALVPQLSSKSLDFSGSANLDIPVGRRGRITGNIARETDASRRVTYPSGVAVYEPRVETDFWTGTLTLTWSL